MSGTQRTAFVLAGGGSLGAIQVGMLQAMLARGPAPDMVVGASVGAINGFYLAADPTIEGVRRLAQIWCELTSTTVFPRSAIRTLLALFGRRRSLLDPAHLRTLLETHVPVRRIEDPVLPCTIIATNGLSGGEVLLATGDSVDALLASTAIPALFPPVHIGGHYLLDGGVSNNAPVSTAIALGATRVVVLPTGFSCALQRPPAGVIAMVLHAFNLMVARQLTRDIERFASTADIVVVPPLCPVPISSYDFSRTSELIARARASTDNWLDAGGLTRHAEIPATLQPHSHST
ncbi:MAG: patatin-like phospholipase family protein [Gemmatimonadaceae bacterium]